MGEKSIKETDLEELDRQMVQNVNWMLERNKDALSWLLTNKYRHLSDQIFD